MYGQVKWCADWLTLQPNWPPICMCIKKWQTWNNWPFEAYIIATETVESCNCSRSRSCFSTVELLWRSNVRSYCNMDGWMTGCTLNGWWLMKRKCLWKRQWSWMKTATVTTTTRRWQWKLSELLLAVTCVMWLLTIYWQQAGRQRRLASSSSARVWYKKYECTGIEYKCNVMRCSIKEWQTNRYTDDRLMRRITGQLLLLLNAAQGGV